MIYAGLWTHDGSVVREGHSYRGATAGLQEIDRSTYHHTSEEGSLVFNSRHTEAVVVNRLMYNASSNAFFHSKTHHGTENCNMRLLSARIADSTLPALGPISVQGGM